MIDNSIENLSLSVRAYNCLKSAGVRTIEDMAIIDLHSLKNCGKKTINEINTKIEQLVSDGRYSPDFVNEHLKDIREQNDYISQLPLSVRAKNTLRKLEVDNEGELLLLDYDIISKVDFAGKKTVKEIIDYIDSNRTILEQQAARHRSINIKIPINSITNFSGNTNIECLPINEMVKKELFSHNIKTILDLVLSKITIKTDLIQIYNAIYDFFYNIAYGPLVLTISSDLQDLYVNIPFDFLNFREGHYIKIKDLIQLVIENFSEMDLDEKINSKLFLNWIDSFDIEDKQKYFVDTLRISEKEFKILSLRGTHTLEEVGNIYGVTRERIRQIEKKAIKKINSNYFKIPFKFIDNKKLYFIKEVDEFYGLLLYIETIKESGSHIFIDNGEDSYYLPIYFINRMENTIRYNIMQLENNGYLVIDRNKWKDSSILTKVCEYLGYEINNNNVFKKLTKRMQVKYAMRHIGRPIGLYNKEDQEEVVRVVFDLFGTKLDTGRALEGHIFDAGVRVDSGKYSADDTVKPLSKETINKIIQYVKSREIINARDLFVEFGDELIDHNLNNETILFRYLRENTSGVLFFNSSGVTISSNPQINSWGDLAIRNITEKRIPLRKLDFIVEHALPDWVYNQLPLYYSDIIVWSSKELYLKSLLDFPEHIRNALCEKIKEKQIVKFGEVRSIINSMDKNLLINNNVKTNDNLFYFLRNVYGDTFEYDKHNEEIRYLFSKKRIIEEKYEETKELTI